MLQLWCSCFLGSVAYFFLRKGSGFSESNKGLQIRDLLQEKTESCRSEGDGLEIRGSGEMWTKILYKPSASWLVYFPFYLMAL